VLEKVTKICSSSGDPVGIEVAIAAGDKDTQELLMANPSNSRTDNVSCSCDDPGCSGFLFSRSYVRTNLCLRHSAAANAMSFSPTALIGARWCYCLEFGDRNLRPVEDDVTLTHEHYVTASYTNVRHTAHVRHNNSHTTLHT
jgi:hypothetical protein